MLQLLTWKIGLEIEDSQDIDHLDLEVNEMHLECIIKICIMEMQGILCTGKARKINIGMAKLSQV